MRFKHCGAVYPLGVLLSLAIWFPCRADTVFLKNGAELEGDVLEDNGDHRGDQAAQWRRPVVAQGGRGDDRS